MFGRIVNDLDFFNVVRDEVRDGLKSDPHLSKYRLDDLIEVSSMLVDSIGIVPINEQGAAVRRLALRQGIKEAVSPELWQRYLKRFPDRRQ